MVSRTLIALIRGRNYEDAEHELTLLRNVVQVLLSLPGPQVRGGWRGGLRGGRRGGRGGGRRGGPMNAGGGRIVDAVDNNVRQSVNIHDSSFIFRIKPMTPATATVKDSTFFLRFSNKANNMTKDSRF